jgi:GMP synthase (glutamine-hydrolysing)
MQPVLILQHLSGDGPAYLATWLRGRGIAFDVRDTEAGQPYPNSLQGFGALAVLGGEMSANDDLPSLRQAEALIREAVRDGVPTLGHCLGGQLMAKALGAAVSVSPAPEVGWQPLRVHASPLAQAWLGDAGERRVFQWHYDAFQLPPGAEGLASSPACPHQAFALGPHLAMQWHVELNAEKLGRWSQEDGEEFRQTLALHPASVHGGPRMRADAVACLPAQQALADRIYARWWAAAAGR